MEGTALATDLFDTLPCRADFVDPEIHGHVVARLKACEEIYFLPNDTVDRDGFIVDDKLYIIRIFGTLPCGSKTCVIITDAPVELLVAVPEGETPARTMANLKSRARTAKSHISSMSVIKHSRLQGFCPEPSPWVRVRFPTLACRKDLIVELRENTDYELASDDATKYFNKVARESPFSTGGWNKLTGYKTSSEKGNRCAYILKVPLANYVALGDTVIPPELGGGANRGMVMQLDIETHTFVQNGSVPRPGGEYTIFMLCVVFFFECSADPVLSVCLTDVPVGSVKPVCGGDTVGAAGGRLGAARDLAYSCGSELGVLEGLIEVFRRMSPDITGAFNGGAFDWPLIRDKLRRYGLLVKFNNAASILGGRAKDTEASVDQWSFTKESVKISADNNHDLDTVLRVPGLIDYDAMAVFLSLFPRAEVAKSASLNYFLERCGLPSKEDMPYQQMFRIYERALLLRGAPTECHCAVGDAFGVAETERAGDSLAPEPFSDSFAEPVVVDGECTACASYMPLIDGPKPLTRCCACSKREKNLADMADVAYYCKIDCVRPQQLCVKRLVYTEKRELATASFTTFKDAFFRANGGKVRNFVGYICHRLGIAYSNVMNGKKPEEKDKYEGGKVFQPVRGLDTENPVTGMDFQSLYPSLMRAFNISPEKLVATLAEAMRLAALGYHLYHVGPLQTSDPAGKNPRIIEAWFVRHCGVIERSPESRIIAGYNKRITYKDAKTGKVLRTVVRFLPASYMTGGPGGGSVQAASGGSITDLDVLTAPTGSDIELEVPGMAAADYALPYENTDGLTDSEFAALSGAARSFAYEPVYGRLALPGEDMGVLALSVDRLASMRRPIKAQQMRLEFARDEMVKAGDPTCTVGGRTYTAAEVNYEISAHNSKQVAVKVLMNTFYGESGNFRSPIYNLAVAAGITLAGRTEITRAYHESIRRGFGVKYGDTDSLYLICAPSVYAGPVAKHARDLASGRNWLEARLELWEAKVAIAMRVMKRLEENLADFFVLSSGTLFLTMAYEEVGFPSIICGKKKYVMTKHMKTINFYSTDYLMRGIEIVKQGQIKVAKKFGMAFINRALAPENTKTLYEIALDLLDEFAGERDPELFKGIARAKLRDSVVKPYACLKKHLGGLASLTVGAPCTGCHCTGRGRSDLHVQCADHSAATDDDLRAGYYPEDIKSSKVRTMMIRMRSARHAHPDDTVRQALYEAPVPGDKFEFVVVRKDVIRSYSGAVVQPKVGDRMEYTRAYEASLATDKPMQIDYMYYLERSIIGLLARFLSYYPDFQPPEGLFKTTAAGGVDTETYKRIDAYIIKAARRLLLARGRDIMGVSNGGDDAFGGACKAAFTTAKRLIAGIYADAIGPVRVRLLKEKFISTWSLEAKRSDEKLKEDAKAAITAAIEAGVSEAVISNYLARFETDKQNHGDARIVLAWVHTSRAILESRSQDVRVRFWELMLEITGHIRKINVERNRIILDRRERQVELTREDFEAVCVFPAEILSAMDELTGLLIKARAIYSRERSLRAIFESHPKTPAYAIGPARG